MTYDPHKSEKYLHGPNGVACRALIESGFDRSSDGVESQRGGGERGVIGGVARGRRVPRESLDACRVAVEGERVPRCKR
jgi:hypothetical protein